MQKRIWIALGVIVLIGVLFWVAIKNEPKNNQQALSQAGSPTPTPKPSIQSVPITNIADSKLPQGFPTDIPLEAGATIIYNYNAVNAQGLYQSTREFISKKTMAENFSLYQTALKKSGWTITSAVADTARNQDIILATQGGNSLNIRIYTDSSNQVHVSISNETKQ